MTMLMITRLTGFDQQCLVGISKIVKICLCDCQIKRQTNLKVDAISVLTINEILPSKQRSDKMLLPVMVLSFFSPYDFIFNPF